MIFKRIENIEPTINALFGKISEIKVEDKVYIEDMNAAQELGETHFHYLYAEKHFFLRKYIFTYDI